MTDVAAAASAPGPGHAAARDLQAREHAVVFDCGGDALLGMVHPAATAVTRGVILVVGGPQYRVGAHRQYLLLARHLAAAGWPAFRFDYRGMGDADGAMRTFEAVADDLAAAVAAFIAATGVAEVVLWGLCDGASAIAFYAGSDPRVRAIALANPWVRTDAVQAAAALTGHYRRRLSDAAAWRRLLTGQVNLTGTVASLAAGLRARLAGRLSGPAGTALAGGASNSLPDPSQRTDRLPDHSLPDRVLGDLCRFQGPVLLILSGADAAAAEFETAARSRQRYRRWLVAPQVTVERIKGADHAFSRGAWRDEVAAATGLWLKRL